MPRHAAASQHRDLVGVVTRFAEFVRDEDDTAPVVGEAACPTQQVVRLLRGQHGGWLVEDQGARVARQRPHDLHALLRADREVAHTGVRVHHQSGRFADGADPIAHPVEVERTSGAEGDVLCDRHRRDEHEMLMHHPHAAADRIGTRLERHRCAVDADGPRVRSKHPEGDAHQRGFPGTILAQQRVDGAACDHAGGVIEGAVPSERVRDARERERLRRRHSPVASCRKVQGMPKVVLRCVASACTPNVSVA